MVKKRIGPMLPIPSLNEQRSIGLRKYADEPFGMNPAQRGKWRERKSVEKQIENAEKREEFLNGVGAFEAAEKQLERKALLKQKLEEL